MRRGFLKQKTERDARWEERRRALVVGFWAVQRCAVRTICLASVVAAAFTSRAAEREGTVFWDGCEKVEVMSTAAGEERRA